MPAERVATPPVHRPGEAEPAPIAAPSWVVDFWNADRQVGTSPPTASGRFTGRERCPSAHPGSA